MHRTQLSILIPTYNDYCVPLVKTLHTQAEKIEGLQYEIIVIDDGSTLPYIIQQGDELNLLSNCYFIRKVANVGRAKVRNMLTAMAHYQWLLFIDSDMQIVNQHFIQQYLQTPIEAQVVYGGNCVKLLPKKEQGQTLRFLYEKAAQKKYLFDISNKHKQTYQYFTTSNFMVAKRVMLKHPFDNHFSTYGYEDVLFSKELAKAHIPIYHINNPVAFQHFESNKNFLTKTKEALRTLYQYRNLLRGNVKILDTYEQVICRYHLHWLLYYMFQLTKILLYHYLCHSKYPSLFIFQCYKLGYYAEYCKKNTNLIYNSKNK